MRRRKVCCAYRRRVVGTRCDPLGDGAGDLEVELGLVAVVVGDNDLTALGACARGVEPHRETHRIDDAAPVILNGPTDGTGIPHTINLSFPGLKADLLLMSLDLAGVWDLPCVFVVENNGYAEATSSQFQQ